MTKVNKAQQVNKFDHEVFGKLEVVIYESKPHFIANQVASVLGYAKPNNAVNTHCKCRILLNTTFQDIEIPPKGLNIIPEKDVYRLVMRSKLPQAEEFQDWVMEEVLPAIRKTGGFVEDVNKMVDNTFKGLDVDIKRVIKSALRKDKNICYVYQVTIDGVLSYVGKGSGNRYLHATSGTSNNYELNKAHFSGKIIRSEILQGGLSDYQARKLEKKLIKNSIQLGMKLLNLQGVKI